MNFETCIIKNKKMNKELLEMFFNQHEIYFRKQYYSYLVKAFTYSKIVLELGTFAGNDDEVERKEKYINKVIESLENNFNTKLMKNEKLISFDNSGDILLIKFLNKNGYIEKSYFGNDVLVDIIINSKNEVKLWLK